MWKVLLLAVLASSASAKTGFVCPSPCTCGGKEGSRYRVDCPNAAIESIKSLKLPSYTTQLSISGNPRLTRIGKDDLSSLTKLDRLNLSGNAIGGIENGAFRNLRLLTKLDLSNNRLTAINSSVFTGLGQLKRLFLTNNLVQEIKQSSFRFLANVERVSLSGNLFSTIPERALSTLTKLIRIDFDSKHLICDCRLKWVVKWMSDTRVNVPDTKCASPPTMKNQLVRNLNRQNLQCDWPVDLRIFELLPASTQLVFAGDSPSIDCKASNDDLKAIYWLRQGRRVVTNATARLQVDEDRRDTTLVVVTLTLNQLSKEKSGSWVCVAETVQGNVTRSISIVVASAYCPQATEKSDKGTYTWPRAVFNSRSEQPCKSGANGAKAFYTCNSEGRWLELDVKACKYENRITQLLKELSMADFNVTTNLDMVKTLMDMLTHPSSVVIADKLDVIFVSRVLRKISSSYDLYTKAEIPLMVYNITSLMMNINSSLLMEAEKSERACTSMIRNLEMVVNYLLESRSELTIHTHNIAVQAHRFPSPSSFTGLTCTAYQNTKTRKAYFPSNFFCTDQVSSPDLAKSKKQKVDAMIHIPSEVASFAPKPNSVKLVVIIYRNDQLFQPIAASRRSTSHFVPSSVMSASIVGANVKGLSTPVMIALPRQDYVVSVPKVQAVYWDPLDSMWKNNGCRISNTVEQSNHNLSIVECDHLTTFSLLQENAVPQPPQRAVDVSFIVLKPQFYVGAVFLCVCLLAVIFTYACSYRTINLSRKLKHSLINTCLSILHLKIIFIFGVKTMIDTIECKVIGMAIHYFSITTIFWITVTTWNIYKKISGRMHRQIQAEEGAAPLPPNPMLKFYLFAWGIPVIICGITGAVNINFYSNIDYCFVAWKPGLLAFYGVVGLFILVNLILYVCICSTKREQHSKVYMDEMMVLNADGCLEPQAMDDSMSNAASIKSSVADTEYRPLAQLTGIILFLVLYILMWASGAFSVALPFQTSMNQVDVILSFLYMILCIILGIFLVVFYCLARNDTRATWHTCCQSAQDADQPPPRSSTNINIISHANAHNSLKREDSDSCSSLKTSSVNNQANPLLQIMQYHKKASIISHSVAGSNSHRDPSIQGSPDDAPVIFNPRQSSIAKRYWEKQRSSRERGMNASMVSVPESSRLQTHSPTSTEPTQHMSIEIQIKSHSSKQARRHRLGSTNSEPADVRNNIYHSMPKSPQQNDISCSSQNRRREPTIGQSKTPSDCGGDTPQFYRYPPDMWQSSVPRNYSHMTKRPSPYVIGGYMRQPTTPYDYVDTHERPSVESVHKQSYVHGYVRSMKDIDNSDDDDDDDESHYSHRSKRSSQRSRPRHHRHRAPQEAEGKQLLPAALNESHASLQSHGTARSYHSSRSGRSAHRHKPHRHGAAEERPLMHAPQHHEHLEPEVEAEEEKLNINHSSSDNNSSHYACTPIQEAKKLNNNTGSHGSGAAQAEYSVPLQQGSDLLADMPASQLVSSQLCIPEERIYENAHNVLPHERPVYTNLEEMRRQATAKQAAAKQAAALQAARSPEPLPDDYELPVYENLFSLNEYDTLKKQKHNVNKGLPLQHQISSGRDLCSPAGGVSPHPQSFTNYHEDDSTF